MGNGIPASDVTQRTGVGSFALPASAPLSFVRATWERWKKIAHAVGVVQTRILMVVFYFVVVLPLGLIMRMTGDPLHLKAPGGSNWTPARHEEQNLSTARRQF